MAKHASNSRPTATCVYCDGPLEKIGKGEHVIQKALGGRAKYLKCVCQTCNGEFSQLDRELCSLSPLAVLAQQAFGVAGGTSWAYDSNHDIALEARPLPGFAGPPLWPQLLLMGEKPIFVFDYEDALGPGVAEFARAFWWCLRAAVHSEYVGARRPRIMWERVRNPPSRGLFPPRVFTEHAFDEFRQGMTFKCRYAGDIDRGWVLHRLANWCPSKRYRADVSVGERNLIAQLRYRWDYVLRGLVKVSLNLLVHVAGPGEVNARSFPDAVRYVRKGGSPQPNPNMNGFIANTELRQFECPADCHRAFLRHNGEGWTCVFAFFGGRLGAVVSFPGPALGEWLSAEVTVPFRSQGSQGWEISTSPLIRPMPRLRVEWRDLGQLIPSIPQRP